MSDGISKHLDGGPGILPGNIDCEALVRLSGWSNGVLDMRADGLEVQRD